MVRDRFWSVGKRDLDDCRNAEAVIGALAPQGCSPPNFGSSHQCISSSTRPKLNLHDLLVSPSPDYKDGTTDRSDFFKAWVWNA